MSKKHPKRVDTRHVIVRRQVTRRPQEEAAIADGFQALDEEREKREADEAAWAAEELDPMVRELTAQTNEEIDAYFAQLRADEDPDTDLPPHPDELACDLALQDFMRWLTEERDAKEAARVEGRYSVNRWPPDLDDRDPDEIFDDPDPTESPRD